MHVTHGRVVTSNFLTSATSFLSRIRASLLLLGIVVFLAISEGVRAQTEDLVLLERLELEIRLLYSAGFYSEAIPFAVRALEIRFNALGPQHPDVASSANILGELYRLRGDNANAERVHKWALAVREKVLGLEHQDTAVSLNNLALVYQAMGTYGEAEVLLTRALAIREKVLGPNHSDTAISIDNLAELYRITGAYHRAEPLYKRALAIFEKTLGPEHRDTGICLNNLALTYWEMGAYAQAEPLYRRALAIAEKTLGPEHPETATSLDNLATLYLGLGDYAQAERLNLRAVAIWEKTLGAEHPETLRGISNLGDLSLVLGDYAQAERLFKRALATREKNLGGEHPDTALSMGKLATFYWATGAYAQAESLSKQALAITEKALGLNHPNTADSLAALSIVLWTRDRWSESAASMQRSLRINETIARQVLLLGDEPRKRAYAAKLTGLSWVAVSFSLASLGKVPAAEHLGLEVVLQRKGQVQDLMTDVFAAARASLSDSDRKVFDQWRETNAALATLAFRGQGQMPAAKYRELREALGTKAASLESDLSQRSAGFRRQVETVTVERVQRALPAGSALIEWFRYEPFIPKAKGKEPRGSNPRFVAYVLKHEGRPVAVDLGDARPIESLLSDLLAALRERGSLVPELARELDARLMQPLRPQLGNAERLLLSPDGQLNLLPFGVLRDEQGRYLVQEKELTYLTSGRDLLRPASTMPSRQAPLVLAAPDFGPLGQTTIAATSTARRSGELAPGAMKFKPLPGTAAEAQAVKAVLGLKDDRVLTGSQATEAVLKHVKGPRILHLATHGFFLPDQPVDPQALSAARESGDRMPAPKGENPLLRSGLVLAGANQLRSGGDDGILTALEVAGLDLQGTELAVLSACETGLGQVNNGEGVYGLRRALVLAGVRTQVASLWKVDDAATKELMSDYYKRLNAGAGRSQALRAAQLAMLAFPRYAHPYYWAAFVVIGDGGPMSR